MAIGRLDVIPGTRLLVCPSGLIGRVFPDNITKNRIWTIINELRPLGRREDIRLRAVDQYGFVSFVSSTDYALLSGRAKPGNLDPMRMREFPEIGDYKNGWEGLTAEHEDLEDDLQIRELELRAQAGWGTLPQLELTRFIHTGGRNMRMLELLLWDADPATGLGPDMRLETIGKRWSQVEKETVIWE